MAITYNKKLSIYSHMHSVQIYLFDSAYYTNIAYILHTCIYNLYMCICIYIYIYVYYIYTGLAYTYNAMRMYRPKLMCYTYIVLYIIY